MSDEVGPPVGGPEVRAEPYAFYRRAGPDLLVGALVPGGLDEPAVVHLHVAVGVEGRPVDGDAEVLVDHDVLERPGPRRLVRALQLDLRLGASVAREDPGGAHGVGEEPKDGVAAVELDGAASVRSEEHTSELQSLMRISYAVF